MVGDVIPNVDVEGSVAVLFDEAEGLVVHRRIASAISLRRMLLAALAFVRTDDVNAIGSGFSDGADMPLAEVTGGVTVQLE